mgnify:CR=1 FL=1
MSIQQKIIVTTADTKERIEFPGDKKWGDVWQLEICVRSIDANGCVNSTRPSPHIIHVTRQTIVDAGLIPPVKGDDAPPVARTEENAEELLLKLLALVGIEPQE